uniref:Mitochondrial glycoprotein family protein n=1 Tax=Arundo donax TaxID=35708 RepID=A0A0A9C2R1_ARUDO
MALFAAARRAAASSVPLLRASASGASRGAALLRPLAAAATRPHPRAMPFSSAPATRPSSDAELLSVIESEIKYAQDCDDHDRVEEIPDNFAFKIIDEKGMNAITLKRTYHGEQIEVLVHMPSLVTGDEPDHDQDGKDEDVDKEGDENQEAEGERPSQSSIPLTVTISKGDGPTLEFTCTAYPDELIIDSLSVTQPSGDEEQDFIAYEGPDFNDLDENLQRAFHKYLELRGLTPIATNFLHEYMINKDSREYLLWLTKLKEFFKQ